MANVRHNMRIPWLGRIWDVIGTSRSIRWLIRLASLGVTIASFIMVETTSGLVQLIASIAVTAMLLVAAAEQVADMARSVQAYQWDRWGRFAWMRYFALFAGVLIVLAVPYMLLVIIYPALGRTPMTSVALATILALAVLAFVLLVLIALCMVGILVWLPVAIVRSRIRERRRRYYRFPAR